ncbi:hypothetical protein OUZ56_010489 [Daphnia magna]|uniref:Uncharacterized protein n=1 Tax=Daphnia magna TaxID=35525 RepID=A0ABR0AIQ8_9CRUS|nr:hypothetical protein OUZ56_010489 [Daphnia magna]
MGLRKISAVSFVYGSLREVGVVELNWNTLLSRVQQKKKKITTATSLWRPTGGGLRQPVFL